MTFYAPPKSLRSSALVARCRCAGLAPAAIAGDALARRGAERRGVALSGERSPQAPRRIARSSCERRRLAMPCAPSTRAQSRRGQAKARLHGNPARALLAFRAMQQNFYIPGTGLYEGEPYSYLWPFSQAFAATISIANIPGQAAKRCAHSRELHVRLFGLASTGSLRGAKRSRASSPKTKKQAKAEPSEDRASRRPRCHPSTATSRHRPAGRQATTTTTSGWGSSWCASTSSATKPARCEQAEQIMAFVMAGWQTNPKALACPGGVPFSDSPSNTDRNTVTDGPAPSWGCSSTGSPATRLPAVRGDGLRMGAPVPAAAQ